MRFAVTSRAEPGLDLRLSALSEDLQAAVARQRGSLLRSGQVVGMALTAEEGRVVVAEVTEYEGPACEMDEITPLL